MISVDWTLGLQFVNFLILLIILNKLLYKPLRKVLTERHQAINGGHARARELESSIEEKMQHYQQQLDAARSAANDEKNRLKKAAAEEEAALLSAAQEKAGKRLQTIKSQVTDQAEEARGTLQSEAETLGMRIATKILGRELT